MKYLICFLLTGCVPTYRANLIIDCVNVQLKLYGDLCAESSTGYEKMNGADAHYEGVKCTVESINECVKR